MLRRTFLTVLAATVALPVFADEVKTLDYTPGLIKERLAAGETLLVDYTTDWCTTCAAQKRQIGALIGENPAYGENITFIRVDFDEYRRHAVSTDRKIPRRSTLIVLKGEDELGRIVANPSKTAIQELMDTALAAATPKEPTTPTASDT
ncbi:thioredoxin family protein [Amylibacter sp. IMCC11727]|uniref:thioredoxin family protein n=1 Tax=Amylibacter sp. IMCC11727 TaxID=3039851 RepID=UPI00244DF910|nr:thioredoxin family protein [Amylibacter sp. IMCC11727]WGI21713.1 thioredoxin family protein [Amylibacter sp. IMCC11727]